MMLVLGLRKVGAIPIVLALAPPRGLNDDGSQAQWFIDGQAAFEAIAASIENAKSEVCVCQP